MSLFIVRFLISVIRVILPLQSSLKDQQNYFFYYRKLTLFLLTKLCLSMIGHLH